MKKEDKMKRLKKIGPLTLGYTFAFIYFVIGLFSAITIASLSVNEQVSANLDPTLKLLGYWIIIVFPIFYALVGFIAGNLLALLYNIISKKTGGVKLDIR